MGLEILRQNIQIQDIMFGFDTINEISEKNKIDVKKTKFDALYGQGIISRWKINSCKTSNVYEFKWNSS